MTKLRIAFMGTPDFAVPSLRALVAAGHEVAAVYCQPPRPAGRGNQLRRSPVQQAAEALGLPVRCPAKLDAPARAEFAALGLDAAVVAAYGLILPAPVLAAPRLGCINVHASLLPRWRGAAPIQRALLAGDAETGITIMQMDEGLDTGPMLLSTTVPIEAHTTSGELHDRLAALGAGLAVGVLEGLAAGRLAPRPQPAEGVTYARKLRREEGQLDWRRPAAELERAVRAFDPWPGAWFEFAGERIKVLAAALAVNAGDAAPGTVIDDRLTVACGDDRLTVACGDDRLTVACGAGALALLRLQRAGREPLDAAAFRRGFPLAAGTVLTCPATS